MKKKVLQQEEIKKLLEKAANAKQLDEARKAQELLEQHYSNSKPELVYNAVKDILTPSKYTRFKQVFKNHAQTVVNKVDRHYNRIFEAHGRVSVIDAPGRPNITSLINEQLNHLFEGISDEKYFRDNAVRHAITQPSSVYLLGSYLYEGELKVQARHIKLKEIHDIGADKNGVRYIIVRHGEENKEDCRWYVYDDVNYSIWRKSQSGFMLDLDYNTDLQPHGNTVCPCAFVFDDDKDLDGNIQKKSILWDSCKDLLEYSIIRTFYSYYKYFSAFGRDVKPATRCTYRSEIDNVQCESGILQPIDKTSVYKLAGTSCPNCNGKNKDVWGEIIEIPISQQTNEALINNYTKLNFRIEADTNVLEFHADDVVRLKDEITNDVIGEGYGKSFKEQAVNADQIRSNFDDQESNLKYFKSVIEGSWEFLIHRVAELVAPGTEVIVKKKLGDKFFLKTMEQLYSELEQLYKGTSNSAMIEQKQLEILLTENRNDYSTLQKYSIVKALKPYSTFPLTYIQGIRQTLNSDQLRLYDNFDQILSIYEARNGKLEGMVIDETNLSLVITNLNSIFNQILNEISSKDDENNNNGGQPGGQQGGSEGESE